MQHTLFIHESLIKMPVRSLHLGAIFFLCFSCFLFSSSAFAAPQEDQTSGLKSIAQQFLNRVAPKLIDQDERDRIENLSVLQSIPDGEVLIFTVRLSDKYLLEGDIIAEKSGGTVLASFKDFLNVMYFPITYEAHAGVANGWYIREDKFFTLDYNSMVATADGVQYRLSDSIRAEDGDLFIPIEELAGWFGMTARVDVTSLLFHVDSKELLPLERRLARRKKDPSRSDYSAKTELPRVGSAQKMFEVPSVDVSVGARYRSPPNGQSTRQLNSTIQAAGDVLQHSGSLLVTGDSEERITSARGKLVKDVEDPVLLGPLKARRYEVGDVINTQIPLIGTARQELGGRITNKKSGAATTFNTTQFIGDLPPGWDVELYRDDQLIDFVTVEDDALYAFNDVQLFAGDNNFRLVFYGPQGEVREEERNIPVTLEQLNEDKAIYDLSVTQQAQNLYNKYKSNEGGQGDITASGTYQRQLTDNLSGIIGYKHRQHGEEQKDVFLTGLSTTIGGAFVNSNLGYDVEGEAGLETSVRKKLGQHDVGVSNYLATDDFEPDADSDNPKVLGFGLNARGPAFDWNDRPVKYGFDGRYEQRANDDSLIDVRQNLNTRIGKLNFNQSNLYRSRETAGTSEDLLESGLTVSGRYLGLNWRARGDYQFKPEQQFDRAFLNVRKEINPELSTEAEVQHVLDPRYTRTTLKANWRPESMIISPQLSYDSNSDLRALVSTRFGIYKEPHTGSFTRTRDRVTGAGVVSVLVFVDMNGNGVLDEGEPPAPDVKVSTLQVSRNVMTDENGIAVLKNIPEYTATDIVLDEGTFSDPFWIAGTPGVSVRTRPGHVHELTYPLVLSGEIDGTVRINRDDKGVRAARNMSLYLYDMEGRKISSTVTAYDGFYIFNKVPPGQYYMLLDNEDVAALEAARPDPQIITIGYEGTILYGQDIILDGSQPDVPFMVMAGFEEYKDRHPHINFPPIEQNAILLNLGRYKSNVAMALDWFKLKRFYGSLIGNADALVPPSESFPDLENNEHVLRVLIRNTTLDDARARCRALNARGFRCGVELLPKGNSPEEI